jgi:hypothetical protein
VAQKRHEQDVPQKNEDASPFSERNGGMRPIFAVSVFSGFRTLRRYTSKCVVPTPANTPHRLALGAKKRNPPTFVHFFHFCFVFSHRQSAQKDRP